MSQELEIWVDFMARMIEKYGAALDEVDDDGDGGKTSENAA